MNKLLATASALALVTITSQALADSQERWPRWYVGVSGGVDFLRDSDIGGVDSGKIKYNTGGAFTGSLGYLPPLGNSFLNNLRVEAEFGYHENSISGVHVDGANAADHGHTHVLSYMGNAYYDFNNSSQWTPYLGAGVGDATVHLDRDSGLGNTNDSNNVLAYQFMAGIAYAPTTIPMTTWSLGYRYFIANDPEFATASGRDKLKDYDAQSVELGAHFRF